MVIPVGSSVSSLDGAKNYTTPLNVDMAEPAYWNSSAGIVKDFFGNTVDPSNPPIGAAAKAYP